MAFPFWCSCHALPRTGERDARTLSKPAPPVKANSISPLPSRRAAVGREGAVMLADHTTTNPLGRATRALGSPEIAFDFYCRSTLELASMNEAERGHVSNTGGVDRCKRVNAWHKLSTLRRKW